MPADPQTEAYRGAAGAVSAGAAVLASERLAQTVDPANWLETFNLWLEQAVPILSSANDRTSTLARLDYLRTRAAEGVTSPFTWQNEELNVEAVRRSMFATAGKALQGIERFDMNPGLALKKAQIEARGVSLRYAMNGARNSTIANTRRDQEAIGAVYLTAGDDRVCYWCAMLASRGPVYKGNSFVESDSNFAAATEPVQLGPGESTAKVHDHCRCIVKVVYREDTQILDEARALYEQWKDVNWKEGWRQMDPRYAHIKNSGQTALREWRRHWEKRA